MSEARLTLYGEARWESPYVFSCFVALREKRLDFDLRLLSLDAGEHRAAEYLERSLTGRVPALRDGDFWLSESSAIEEYLEEAFPPPGYPALYPRGPRERARARQLQAWLRSDLLPLREERPTRSVFGRLPVKPLGAPARATAERLLHVAGSLLPPGAASLFGDFTIADADLALMLQRLLANGDPVPDRLRAYAAGVWRRPSVREFADHPRPAP